MIRACGGFSRLLCTEVAAGTSRSASSVTIPYAVKRTSTELLEALSGTVGEDKTAPHFSLIDDPALIPSSNNDRRFCHLSKEMGRRTARLLAQEWPTLFMYDRDDPRLEVFRPRHPSDPLTVEPTQENLRQMVDERRIAAASKLYERIRTTGADVSRDLQLDLFRLAVYYNGDDPPPAEIEEWHSWRNYGSVNYAPPEWEQAGVADLLFESLQKTEETYSLMIAGLLKYPGQSSVQRANSLYKEMESKQLRPHVEAFCGLIRQLEDINSAVSFLRSMRKLGIMPDMSVFNCVIEAANREKISVEQKCEFIGRVLREAALLGISPNLRTFTLILQATQVEVNETEKAYESEVLPLTYVTQMLDELEKRDRISATERNEEQFFIDAMDVALKASNMNVANRIEKLYSSEKNQAKLPVLTGEAEFYYSYLRVAIFQLPIDLLVTVYCSLVPRIVCVSRTLALEVLQRLESTPNWTLLRRIIDDIISSGLFADMGLGSRLRARLLAVDLTSLSVLERDAFMETVNRCVDRWDRYSNCLDENTIRLQRKWTRNAIIESALLLVRVGERQRGWKLLALALSETAMFGPKPTVERDSPGRLQQDVLRQLMKEALQEENWEGACNCLQLIAGESPQAPLEPLIEQIIKKCTLNQEQVAILNNFWKVRK